MAADFNAGVLTDKGKALLAKWHEGSCVPELTRAAAGAGSYSSGEDLNGRTALKDERMSIGFSHIETQNETTVALRFTLTNEDLTEGFTITEIGVFATDPDEGEILYSIATTADESNADYMPAYNGEYPTTIIFNYQIEVANASNVTIVAGSTGMYALAADLEAAEVKIGNLETATADLEDQIEDAVKELEEDIVVKVDEAKEAADKAQETADQAVKDAASAQNTADQLEEHFENSARTYYGQCSSGEDEITKVVTCNNPDFEIKTGTHIAVQFSNASTPELDNLTGYNYELLLNIGGKTLNIYRGNTYRFYERLWNKHDVVEFVYTESYGWMICNSQKADTSTVGMVRLSSSVNNNSEDLAATPSAVKYVYDLASTAQSTAEAAQETAEKAVLGDIPSIPIEYIESLF